MSVLKRIKPIKDTPDGKLWDGEPFDVPLVKTKYDNNDVLRGHLITVCCGCGLEHMETFEVFQPKNSKDHLVMRSRTYADQRTWPVKVTKSKRRK